MNIEKFRSVDENKTVYAVTGANNYSEALNYVCQYKKANKADFFMTHDVCLGTMYNDDLYVGDFDSKHKTNCIIVFRNTIDMKKYA